MKKLSIVRRDQAKRQDVAPAILPLILFMAGFLIFTIGAMLISQSIFWDGKWGDEVSVTMITLVHGLGVAGIGFLLGAPWLVIEFTPWRLMVCSSEREDAREEAIGTGLGSQSGEVLMKKLLIVHRERNKLQRDGWTYGDWRQYVAFFEDKTAICCRISGLPPTLAMVGLLLIFMAAMGIVSAMMGIGVIWPRIVWSAVIGVALWVPWIVFWFTSWRLVVPVSKPMKADEEGSYWRDF